MPKPYGKSRKTKTPRHNPKIDGSADIGKEHRIPPVTSEALKRLELRDELFGTGPLTKQS